MEEKNRGSFSGNLGFVLAAAGAAVGLGNIWKFPYLAGSSGGGIFLLIYVVVCVVVGLPLLVAETGVGRHGQSDAYTSFSMIADESKSKNPKFWGILGFLGTLCGMIIYTYYVVVGGWVTGYVYKTATVPLNSLDGDAFGAFISSPLAPLAFTVIFTALCFIIIWGGVQKGIEKACKVIMPALFILLIIVLIRVVTLPGALGGVEYLFVPNVDRMQEAGGFGKVALAAMCQSFWSLSLGQGIMVIYGSYQKRNSNLITNAVSVAVLDTMVALLAGTCVLGAVFAFGQEPAAGAGMLFGSLTLAFGSMGSIGTVFGCLFFIAVLLAALSSAISLLEVSVSFLTDTCHIDRKKALVGFSIVAFIISCIASLANGALSGITIGGLNLFDALGWLAETFLLPVAAFCVSIFVGWVWKPQNALLEITNEGTIPFRVGKIWGFLIKYVLPIAIAYIFIIGVF